LLCCVVLRCVALCCAMLCCVVLSCVVLRCTTLCCVVLRCVVLCCVVLCCVVLRWVVLCCVVLRCVVLRCAVLCYVVLCCVVLCCVVLCCVVCMCTFGMLASSTINYCITRKLTAVIIILYNYTQISRQFIIVFRDLKGYLSLQEKIRFLQMLKNTAWYWSSVIKGKCVWVTAGSTHTGTVYWEFSSPKII
jgi:hypothetical protein